MLAALAEYDFGTVFRRVRGHTGWSQQVLGDLVGLDQPRISMIERGVRRLRDVALVAQVAAGLCIPPALLGFGAGSGTIVNSARGDARELVSWMQRRDFVQTVAGLALGVAGITALDVDRLIALLPHADPTGTRHVGASDVAVIEEATAAFTNQDFATGAGPVRELAIAQLGSVLPLLDAQMSEETRPRLYLATARLATQAGWMSFECNQHEAARRLWMIALDVARSTDHPLAADQSVFVLYDLALQAAELGRPKEALRLAQLGHTAAVSAHPASPATMSCLTTIQARAHGAQSDTNACDRALGESAEHFTSIDPASHECMAGFLNEAHLASLQGGAYYELALAGRDPHAAGQAVPLLRQAVDGFSSGYARTRALYLPRLAGAHAIADDVDTAVSLGHQAIDAVTALHSPRAHDRLRVLNTALAPLYTNAGVTEFRNRLTTTAT